MKITEREARQVAEEISAELELFGHEVDGDLEQVVVGLLTGHDGQVWKPKTREWQPVVDLDPEIMKKELALYIHFRERVMAAIKHEFINVNVRHAYKELMEGLEKLSGAQDR